MTTVVKNGQAIDDAWIKPAADEALPSDGPVLLTRERFLAEREALAGRNAPLGLFLNPGESIEGIEADLKRFVLIELAFPKYTDGRSYSMARLLRERHGYAGELRASGDVLHDQIPLMQRCGFDAFAISHPPTLKAMLEGRVKGVSINYQPAGLEGREQHPPGPRPWLRRSI